jgi:ACS family hexuronate transporter-like MFS transporter
MLLPASLFIASAPLQYAIVFFSTVMFGHQCFASIMQTLPADLFSSRNVGSVAGLLGAAGSFGAMLFSYLVGKIIGANGYAPAFLIAGLLHPTAFAVVLLTVRRVRPLHLEDSSRVSSPP